VIICQVQSCPGDGELSAATATYYLEIIRYYNTVPLPSTTKLLSFTQGTGEGLAYDQRLVKISVHGQDCPFYPFCNCEDFAFMIDT